MRRTWSTARTTTTGLRGWGRDSSQLLRRLPTDANRSRRLGGGLTEFASLMHGLYRLRILAAQVSGSGQPLDGDANGTAGGDFTLDLHRLYGDVNGDKAVHGLDFAAFRAIFGASPGAPMLLAPFDFHGVG